MAVNGSILHFLSHRLEILIHNIRFGNFLFVRQRQKRMHTSFIQNNDLQSRDSLLSHSTTEKITLWYVRY